MDDLLTSRFFRRDDLADRQFVFTMPQQWWSRKYEYHWAGQFADPAATVLDAACGIEHPLKFFLLDHCRACYACDLDQRLLDRDALRQSVVEGFHVEPAEAFPDRYLDEVDYRIASLLDLPYDDAQFDRIFCVSVLEHLRDRCNRYPWLSYIPPLAALLRRDIRDALAEFKRSLKPAGLIVLTFDYPRINLRYLRRVVEELDLQFAGPCDFTLPTDAIFQPEKKLHCFRAVLSHRGADLSGLTLPKKRAA
jgi:SAM-dependent methyltransferase